MADPAPLSPLAPKKFPALPPIEGVRFATIAAGVRYAGRTDVMLALFDRPARSRACSRARNALRRRSTGAAPICPRASARAGRQFRQRQRLHRRRRLETTVAVAEAAAKATGAAPHEIYMASTGVIGEPLEAAPIVTRSTR